MAAPQIVETKHEIKDCPFCGHPGELIRIFNHGFVVRCSNEKCRAEQITYREEKEALAAWNKRICTCKGKEELDG